jgi:hypothetical protein
MADSILKQILNKVADYSFVALYCSSSRLNHGLSRIQNNLQQQIQFPLEGILHGSAHPFAQVIVQEYIDQDIELLIQSRW